MAHRTIDHEVDKGRTLTSGDQQAVPFPLNPVIAIVALVVFLMLLWTVVWGTIGPV